MDNLFVHLLVREHAREQIRCTTFQRPPTGLLLRVLLWNLQK